MIRALGCVVAASVAVAATGIMQATRQAPARSAAPTDWSAPADVPRGAAAQSAAFASVARTGQETALPSPRCGRSIGRPSRGTRPLHDPRGEACRPD